MCQQTASNGGAPRARQWRHREISGGTQRNAASKIA